MTVACHHTPELVQVIGSNGSSFILERCSTCLERLRPDWVPHTGLTLETIPVVEDHRLEVPPCRRCGQRGAELHHFAPQALFDDADLWPQDWLCRSCHIQWHQVMNSASKADAVTTAS